VRFGFLAAIAAVAVAIASASIGGAAQTPTFRTTTSTVAVNVSVRRGNAVVANLTASDFRLTDNGVPQVVQSVSIETVPIDVTLFLDTSGSTEGKLEDMKRDLQAIAAMLRPGDRFRLLTIGDAVEQPVPWTPAGATFDVSFEAVGGISLIHDALLVALVHRVEPGRRHLVVGMTDRQDCGSVIPSALLLELAGRTEAVMHLIDYSGGGGQSRYRVRSCTPRAALNGEAAIRQATERTGGLVHTGSILFRSASIVRAFRSIFDDFRQSYVLRYSPTGVTMKGWHAIAVQVPDIRNATIRARQGYYGD
jgi:VWFA-related protein